MKTLLFFLMAMFISLLSPGKHEKEAVLSGQQDQPPIFSFGIFADAQYCNCEPSGTRFYRNSLHKLEVAFNAFKEANPDFILNLGDLIDRDYESFDPVMKIIASCGIKVYHVAGNHDFSVSQGQKKRVIPLLTGKKGYYSFERGAFRFIVLDGNEVSTYGPGGRSLTNEASSVIFRLQSEGEPNGFDWNGGIGTRQLAWLADQLEKSSQARQKVFIVCHFPVWPVNEHNLFNYKEVLDLLNKHDNIIAWLNGHNHAGNYGNTNMIHFLTFKGMVETEETGSFAIIEVYGNKLWIKGYGRERSMILAY